MFNCLHASALLLGWSVAFTSFAPAQEGARSDRTGHSRPPLERLRERLGSRPDAERMRLERNLDQFEALPQATRVRLLERARILRERERSFDTHLSRELRGRLSELRGEDLGGADLPEESSNEFGNERASDLWRTWLRESLRERGREVRARLPEDLRRRLEEAPPELRRRLLEGLLGERERVARRALVRLRERFGLPPHEVDRLERMPLLERLHALRELKGRQGRLWR